MELFAAFSLLVSCGFGIALASRLLRLWLQSRLVPELSIGICGLALSLGAIFLAVAMRFPGRASHPAFFPLLMTALFMLAASAVALFVGNWRIFRPAERWPMIPCALGTLALIAWLVLAWRGGGSGLQGESDLRALFYYTGRAGVHLWSAIECFGYHAKLKRRARIGLADPMIAHQFLLWGISTTAMLLTFLASLVAGEIMQQSVLLWTPGLFAVSALGLVGSGGIWFAFFPPAAYRRWILARAGQPEQPGA